MELVRVEMYLFCDWKPVRFRTTSLRRKSNKLRLK